MKKPRQGLTYLEQRELDTFPERIEALEAEQARLHAQLEDADLFRRDPATFQTIMERLTALETELPAACALGGVGTAPVAARVTVPQQPVRGEQAL